MWQALNGSNISFRFDLCDKIVDMCAQKLLLDDGFN